MRWKTALVNPKQELASLLTNRINVLSVTSQLVWYRRSDMITPTRVEIRHSTDQIMVTSTSKPWGKSWYSDREQSLNSQTLSREAIGK